MGFVDYFSLTSLSVWGLTLFFALVLAVVLFHAKVLFFTLHGWSHRVAGAALLAWLIYGVGQIVVHPIPHVLGRQDSTPIATTADAQWFLFYDTVLGVLGITTTLTAARDFPHKYLQNAKGQSGSLSEKALVTQNEMIEHSFYQALNLLQAWYLHFVSSVGPTTTTTTSFSKSEGQDQEHWQRQWQPWLALWVVTSPWLIRSYFPVHSFSHNWKVTPAHQRTSQEVLLYRIKKGQYLFYKHVLLHGLNISMALQSLPRIDGDESATTTTRTTNSITATTSWRMYWLALNTSYVMEFFLQSLVRRKILSISSMFGLQRLLMATSSVAAMLILFQEQMVRPSICLVSLMLNFGHRHHDVLNVLLTAGIFYSLPLP